jgi:hypothetical protein
MTARKIIRHFSAELATLAMLAALIGVLLAL